MDTSLLSEKCTGLLILEISGVEYCLSNTLISSISKPENNYTLEVAETLKYSLLQVDNMSIPLIDLKKVLTGVKQQIDGYTRIVIIEYENIRLGLLIERIEEIIAVDTNFVATTMKYNADVKIRYIKGTVEYEDRKFLLLNIAEIVDDMGCI